MVKQDTDIKDRKGSQPAKYYAGKMKKSTKSARAKHFEKGSKMSDDNPKAYKDAPGDKTGKTKPSIRQPHLRQQQQLLWRTEWLDCLCRRCWSFRDRSCAGVCGYSNARHRCRFRRC